MREDFPAAHSMDTYWFAVDGKGHVAIFVTGECGHVPDHAGEPGLRRSEASGIFEYDFDDYGPIQKLYFRITVPEVPLHIDQLPPEQRAGVKALRFDGLDFAAAEQVQPLEFFRCHFYGGAHSYLASDGKTVRAVPGREQEHAEFVARLRLSDQPYDQELLARHVFEVVPGWEDEFRQDYP